MKKILLLIKAIILCPFYVIYLMYYAKKIYQQGKNKTC